MFEVGLVVEMCICIQFRYVKKVEISLLYLIAVRRRRCVSTAEIG